MKSLLIFGISDAALMAYYYFTSDSNYCVVGFVVDADFMPQDKTFCGLPVIEFQGVEALYPPTQYMFFVALGYSNLNQVRKDKYLAVKAKGYRLASYISSKATLLSPESIGENCFILENNTIQPFVKIGDNVTLWSSNHVGHHSVVENHCFLASHIVISGRVHIGESCFIGVNATLRDHILVGENCIIGAGALILEDASAGGVYMGIASSRSRVPSKRLRGI